jgi:hypothetical protein
MVGLIHSLLDGWLSITKAQSLTPLLDCSLDHSFDHSLTPTIIHCLFLDSSFFPSLLTCFSLVFQLQQQWQSLDRNEAANP